MSAHPGVLHGKVALVTGASSGIGEATARLLVILGVHVIGLARRGEKLNGIARSLRGAKGTFDPYPGDVRNESNIMDAFAYAAANYRGIDILVNDAGIVFGESVTEAPTDHLRDVLDTNLLGAVITNKEAVKSMRRKGGPGHIVNIVSVAGLDATVTSLNIGIYPATKFGLHAVTENIRQEMTQTKTNIRVTGIYPGFVDTNLWAKGGVSEAAVRSIPHLEAANVADTVIFALTRPRNVQINRVLVEPLNPINSL